DLGHEAQLVRVVAIGPGPAGLVREAQARVFAALEFAADHEAVRPHDGEDQPVVVLEARLPVDHGTGRAQAGEGLKGFRGRRGCGCRPQRDYEEKSDGPGRLPRHGDAPFRTIVRDPRYSEPQKIHVSSWSEIKTSSKSMAFRRHPFLPELAIS